MSNAIIHFDMIWQTTNTGKCDPVVPQFFDNLNKFSRFNLI